MEPAGYIPVFEATRGKIVESVQFGAAAVVDTKGELVASLGDPELVTYLRSSAKPFQALPFMQEGGDEKFKLTGEETAILCASHSGTDRHVQVVQALQKKIGIPESALQCGTHPPSDADTKKRMIHNDEALSPNRHNCSGKHSGMLAYARMHGYDLENYIRVDHPVQQKILAVFSEMVGMSPAEIAIGIDGCSVPTFALPLKNAALAYARLADPSDLEPDRASACRRITLQMTSHPWVIAGPDKFDTCIMEVAGSRLVTKTGAEGFQALAVFPDAIQKGSPALGVALKISDGDLEGRARPVVMLEILKQLGVLSAGDLAALKDHAARPIYNFRHLLVGEYLPAFSLTK